MKFPKPLKRPKKKCRIEEDPDYINWIKRFPCIITSYVSIDPNTGLPASDPHHVNEPGHGIMGGKTSDRRAIPLCHQLHDEIHRLGDKSFAKKYKIDFEITIAALNRLYERDQHGS